MTSAEVKMIWRRDGGKAVASHREAGVPPVRLQLRSLRKMMRLIQIDFEKLRSDL